MCTQVRGPNYLRDKKKILASEPLFALAAVDLVECESGCFHIAHYLPSLKCVFRTVTSLALQRRVSHAGQPRCAMMSCGENVL